jgi:hypothetical protein
MARLFLALPAVGLRQREATPPGFVSKASGPPWLVAGPGNQSVAGAFFNWYGGSGLVIQCLAQLDYPLELPPM